MLTLNVDAIGTFIQPGEGPIRGLLCDYEPSCGPSFEALHVTVRVQGNYSECAGRGCRGQHSRPDSAQCIYATLEVP